MIRRTTHYGFKAFNRHRLRQAKDSSFLVGTGIAIMAGTFAVQKAIQMSETIDFKSHTPTSQDADGAAAAASKASSPSESFRKRQSAEQGSESKSSGSTSSSSSSSSSRPSSSSKATGGTSDGKAGGAAQESAFSAFFSSFFARNFYDGGFEEKMTKREAALILGVRESAAIERVKDAHRRVLIINHPDKGGSAFLAAKINEAKDLLLKGKQ